MDSMVGVQVYVPRAERLYEIEAHVDLDGELVLRLGAETRVFFANMKAEVAIDYLLHKLSVLKQERCPDPATPTAEPS